MGRCSEPFGNKIHQTVVSVGRSNFSTSSNAKGHHHRKASRGAHNNLCFTWLTILYIVTDQIHTHNRKRQPHQGMAPSVPLMFSINYIHIILDGQHNNAPLRPSAANADAADNTVVGFARFSDSRDHYTHCCKCCCGYIGALCVGINFGQNIDKDINVM